jgi:hypothetical protein
VPKYTGVTDHNIYGFRFTIKGGGKVEAAKLQLEGEVCARGASQAGGKSANDSEKDNRIPFLLNICINAHSFLAREFDVCFYLVWMGRGEKRTKFTYAGE